MSLAAPISTRRPSARPPRRLVGRVFRLLLATAAVVGVSVGLVLYLTSPDRGKRVGAVVTPRRALNASPTVTSTPPAQAGGPQIPLYSDDWLDDSGYGYARQNSLPVTDPRSLEQVRAYLEGRAQRGIARNLEKMRRIAHGTKEGRARALQLNIILGLLHMADGEFIQADRRFADAQEADPG